MFFEKYFVQRPLYRKAYKASIQHDKHDTIHNAMIIFQVLEVTIFKFFFSVICPGLTILVSVILLFVGYIFMHTKTKISSNLITNSCSSRRSSKNFVRLLKYNLT